jgi:serine/threonine protein phosphatase PrpC
MVEDRHIEELILQGGTDVRAACAALVARANAKGGKDNISMMLAYNNEVGRWAEGGAISVPLLQ